MNTLLDRLPAWVMACWLDIEYRQRIREYRERQGLSEVELLEKSWELPAGKGLK